MLKSNLIAAPWSGYAAKVIGVCLGPRPCLHTNHQPTHQKNNQLKTNHLTNQPTNKPKKQQQPADKPTNKPTNQSTKHLTLTINQHTNYPS